LSMIARKAFSRASVATSSRPITGYSQLCRSPAKIAASCAVPSGRAGLTAPHPSIASRTGPFKLALLPPGRTVPLPRAHAPLGGFQTSAYGNAGKWLSDCATLRYPVAARLSPLRPRLAAAKLT
jgi:hypothetical protein